MRSKGTVRQSSHQFQSRASLTKKTELLPGLPGKCHRSGTGSPLSEVGSELAVADKHMMCSHTEGSVHSPGPWAGLAEGGFRFAVPVTPDSDAC